MLKAPPLNPRTYIFRSYIFVELLWGVDIVPFGIDWFSDEVGAGDDQVELNEYLDPIMSNLLYAPMLQISDFGRSDRDLNHRSYNYIIIPIKCRFEK